MHIRPLLTTLLCTVLTFASCASVDCSLDSIVVWTLSFFDSESGESVKIPYELTVEADGVGTLYNRAVNVNSIILPMSHNFSTDTLHFIWVDRSKITVDEPTEDPENPDNQDNQEIPNNQENSEPQESHSRSTSPIPGLVGYNILLVDHTNHPHFDAIDCPAAVFHTITDTHLIPTTDPNYVITIDSINVVRPTVDYQDVENIRLYLNFHRPAESSNQAVRQ